MQGHKNRAKIYLENARAAFPTDPALNNESFTKIINGVDDYKAL
jgi:hypothetical protein